MGRVSATLRYAVRVDGRVAAKYGAHQDCGPHPNPTPGSDDDRVGLVVGLPNDQNLGMMESMAVVAHNRRRLRHDELPPVFPA
jgi:hypothetical protein